MGSTTSIKKRAVSTPAMEKRFVRQRGPNEEGFFTEYFYVDDGCEVSTSCLNCPLPICKHDDPLWFKFYRHAAKQRILLRTLQLLTLTTIDIEYIASQYNIAPRSVFRLRRRIEQHDYDFKWVDFFAKLYSDN